jgi:hypothetical protein
MSEYQIYEFAAIDRPLTAGERQELRAISSRARISATSFVNTYDFGDLKADPLKLLDRYFDVFVYLANWGTRRFALRVPKRLIDLQAIEPFHLDGDLALVRTAGENVIISITRDEIEDDEWDDESGHLAALAPLRADLLAGDMRLFSLLWLAQVENGWIRDEAVEPAPGLTEMSAGLAALADFLAIDPDLIEAACPRSAVTSSKEPTPQEIEDFVRALAEREKVALLVRLCSGGDPHLSAELRQRCQKAHRHADVAVPQRTAGELRAAARLIAEKRARAAEEKAKAERLAREQREAREREQRLSGLARRGEAVWRDVEEFIGMRNTAGYERAATLLADLGTIASSRGEHESFARRLAELRARHERKGQFIKRLKDIGLVGSQAA